MENKIILPALNGLVRNKLKERVLEIIDLPKGKTDKNILEYIEIARQNGFSEEEWLLREKVFELGEAQLKRVINPRGNRRQKEKELEDYLELNGLEHIEPGMRFINRQTDLVSGITDISAVDSMNVPVTMELKARDYDWKDVFAQLMKYAGEKKDDRIIFVAPEVKPELFFAVQAYSQGDRFSFYAVQEDGKDFSFELVDKDSFGDAPKRNFEFNGRRTEEDSDLVTVVRGAKPKRLGRRKKDEKKNGNKFEGGEEIEPGTFHPIERLYEGLTSFEFNPNKGIYLLNGEVFDEKKFEEIKKLSSPHQILIFQPEAVRGSKIDLESRIKLSLELGEKQIDILRALKFSPEMENVVNRFGNYKVSIIKYREYVKSGGDFNIGENFSPRTRKILLKIQNSLLDVTKNFDDKFREFFNEILNAAHGEIDDSKINCLKILKGEMNKIISKLSKSADLNKVRAELSARFHALGDSVEKGAIGYALRHSLLFEQEIKNEWARLKMIRFHELGGIDSVLARSYLTYNPITLELARGMSRSNKHQDFINFLGEDHFSIKIQSITNKENSIDMLFYLQTDDNAYHITVPELAVQMRSAELIKSDEKVKYAGNALIKTLREQGIQVSSLEEAERMVLFSIANSNEAGEKKQVTYGERLVSGITSGFNGKLSEDMDARIGYFAEDIERYGLSEEAREKLVEGFSDFSKVLYKQFRNRENAPNDVKMRNFFDDIELNFLRKGKIPEKKDLERTYENA